MRRLNVLLLCNRPARNADASTVTDHLDAFTRLSRHNLSELSFIRELPHRVALERFDAIVIHYSTALGYQLDHYISLAARQRVREFRGLKVAFVQDEYRMVDRVHDVLRFLGVEVLFTCLPVPEIEKVYPASALPGLTKIQNLTGYVPARLLRQPVPRIVDRPIDVGYRTRRMPFWLGELGAEKSRIAEGFVAHARNAGLRLDISCEEADRLYGDRWITFVGSCKAMLGVESGSSIFDFTGELQHEVEGYLARYPDATFEEVHAKFLGPHEGRIRLNQVSPRCFEAAALRTAMVLYEGHYSGVLEAGRHFIPLKKDFSNFAHVLAALRDKDGLQRMVDRTFEEVAENPAYSYGIFIQRFDETLAREFEERNKPLAARPYDRATLRRDMLRSPAYVWKRLTSACLQRVVLGTRLRRLVFRVWGQMPSNTRTLVRPVLRIIGR